MKRQGWSLLHGIAVRRRELTQALASVTPSAALDVAGEELARLAWCEVLVHAADEVAS